MSNEERARDLERAATEKPEERRQYLLEAAETWHIAGNDERARELFEQVLDGEGRTVSDVRIAYATFLLGVREPQRARELLDQAWRDRELSGLAHVDGGEVYEIALDDPATALRWYTRGIMRSIDTTAAPTGDALAQDMALPALFAARHRVRQAVGQPADEWDELWEKSREKFQADLGGDDNTETRTRRSAGHAVLYWPPAELAEYRRRWPDGYPGFQDVAEPHLEHRREVERTLRASLSGTSPMVAIGDAAHFADFVADRDLDGAKAATRASYAVELNRTGTSTVGLPGRNEPCWCGSGRKYKKCCGAPAFTD
ncbi:SEC-C motif-containing protein [Amycolatopsis marina]|uniref:SEC-C motif-containing protein n=1 Tax=Amycolatopsis marina TaxID=490629 RepID=A0A1I0XK66_9PSEU|nr:SEC-C metal-binding domain-containing protein [Amycolatopsis marina]SFB01425.1 SEC-C motif-containing protein [Amycolatopsis marina]